MPCGPCGLVPKLPARQQYHQVLKGAGHASRHGRAHFGRLVNAADMGGKTASHLGAGIRHAQLTLKRTGQKGFGANIRGSCAPEQRLSTAR